MYLHAILDEDIGYVGRAELSSHRSLAIGRRALSLFL